MAPEVLRNNYYGVEVDLWAVGIILFELKKKFHPYQNGIVKNWGNPKSKIESVYFFSTDSKYHQKSILVPPMKWFLKVRYDFGGCTFRFGKDFGNPYQNGNE